MILKEVMLMFIQEEIFNFKEILLSKLDQFKEAIINMNLQEIGQSIISNEIETEIDNIKKILEFFGD